MTKSNIPETIYTTKAWQKLYNTFEEQIQDEEMELINAIMEQMVIEEEEQQEWLLRQDGSEDTKYCG